MNSAITIKTIKTRLHVDKTGQLDESQTEKAQPESPGQLITTLIQFLA